MYEIPRVDTSSALGGRGNAWSPAGTWLLIVISQWTWGTDSTWNTKYILSNPSTGELRELPITAAIQKHFAKPCTWLVSSQGWLDDGRIDIELKPNRNVGEEGDPGPTPSCVEKATRFEFDADSAEISVTSDTSPYHSLTAHGPRNSGRDCRYCVKRQPGSFGVAGLVAASRSCISRSFLQDSHFGSLQ